MRLTSGDLLGGNVLPDVSQDPTVKAARIAFDAAQAAETGARRFACRVSYTPASILAYRKAGKLSDQTFNTLEKAEEEARALLDKLKGE